MNPPAAVQEDPRAIADWLRLQLRPGARLCADSREVKAGDAFIAFPGLRTDGRQFIAQALLNGARAILWQSEVFNWPHLNEAPQRAVSQLKHLAGAIAHEYYGRPSDQLDIVAVTGTNGKTSCSQWIAAGYLANGSQAAVIGTLGSGPVGRLDSFGMTTPDAISLHGMLAGFQAAQIKQVAIEASSIGLDQGRLDGVRIAAAVFTNLTHDHLDYHQTMQAYGNAKALLFGRGGLRLAVVNGDDPACVSMLNALRDEATDTIAYGSTPRQHGLQAKRFLVAEAIEPRTHGTTLSIAGDLGRATIELRVLGRFNALNVLAVMATWIGLGMTFERACQLASGLQPVRGRMEKVLLGAESNVSSPITIDTTLLDPLVVVDYAHTPDALENALQTLRPIAQTRGGGLWCVFGAGGDRDPSKRPIMGRTVEAIADHIVITSDNPRGESPFKIIADIRSGLSREPHASEVDRAQAIKLALREAQPTDVVLIAGKGHEEYQEVAGQRLPFSDVEVARAALLSRSEAIRV